MFYYCKIHSGSFRATQIYCKSAPTCTAFFNAVLQLINVLPFELGLQLGEIWDDRKAIIQLAGNLSNHPAMPFSAIAQIADCPPTELLFAWVQRPNTAKVPLLLAWHSYNAGRHTTDGKGALRFANTR